MQLIEKPSEFSNRFSKWRGGDNFSNYPFVENVHAPFAPLRRALPMLNLGLVSAAGAYLEGTDPFDTESRDGDVNFREFPINIDSEDFEYAARGYDPAAVKADRNALVPIDRLLEYQGNAVIGKLNDVWWSVSSHIPNARAVADTLAPKIAERLHRYEVQAALLIPSSMIAHQTIGIIARGIEATGIPTIMISVDTAVTDRVRPPRTAYYKGHHDSVAGKPNWPEYQLRILDEAIRWIETFDQPGARKLAVDLETLVETARGER